MAQPGKIEYRKVVKNPLANAAYELAQSNIDEEDEKRLIQEVSQLGKESNSSSDDEQYHPVRSNINQRQQKYSLEAIKQQIKTNSDKYESDPLQVKGVQFGFQGPIDHNQKKPNATPNMTNKG